MAVLVIIGSKNETVVDCACDWKLISPRNPNFCKRCGGFINYKVGI